MAMKMTSMIGFAVQTAIVVSPMPCKLRGPHRESFALFMSEFGGGTAQHVIQVTPSNGIKVEPLRQVIISEDKFVYAWPRKSQDGLSFRKSSHDGMTRRHEIPLKILSRVKFTSLPSRKRGVIEVRRCRDDKV
jgi:hypothetical protein